MNWQRYQNLLEMKVTEAKHNLEYEEKKFKEAKSVYNAAIRDKEAFECELEIMMDKVETK